VTFSLNKDVGFCEQSSCWLCRKQRKKCQTGKSLLCKKCLSRTNIRRAGVRQERFPK
jgi:hypothetical protein